MLPSRHAPYFSWINTCVYSEAAPSALTLRRLTSNVTPCKRGGDCWLGEGSNGHDDVGLPSRKPRPGSAGFAASQPLRQACLVGARPKSGCPSGRSQHPERPELPAGSGRRCACALGRSGDARKECSLAADVVERTAFSRAFFFFFLFLCRLRGGMSLELFSVSSAESGPRISE